MTCDVLFSKKWWDRAPVNEIIGQVTGKRLEDCGVRLILAGMLIATEKMTQIVPQAKNAVDGPHGGDLRGWSAEEAWYEPLRIHHPISAGASMDGGWGRAYGHLIAR